MTKGKFILEKNAKYYESLCIGSPCEMTTQPISLPEHTNQPLNQPTRGIPRGTIDVSSFLFKYVINLVRVKLFNSDSVKMYKVILFSQDRNEKRCYS